MNDIDPFEIIQVEVGLLQNFVTLIACRHSGQAMLCDPAFEVDRIFRLMEERGLRLCGVLVTHSHPDHIDGVPDVIARSPAMPIYVGRQELRGAPWEHGGNLIAVDGGETLRCGSLSIEVIATPGHTAGGRSFYLPQAAAVLTGDTLFVGSCGRPSFPDSDARLLYHSLQRLAALPEETRIFPGHDYGKTNSSLIGWEITENPALRCPDERSFLALVGQRQRGICGPG